MMESNAMIPAVCAAYLVCFLLMDMRFGRLWGVDSGRMTPACERGRGTDGAALLGINIVYLLAPTLLAAESVQTDLMISVLIGGLFALVCGSAAYMLLFVGVRCGGVSAAQIAQRELGTPAEKAMHLLAFAVSCALGASMIRYGLAAIGVLPAMAAGYPALFGLLAGLCVLPCGVFAARIRCEDDCGALTLGGAGVAALCAAALCAARTQGLLAVFAPHRKLMEAGFALLCAASVIVCAVCGGAALRMLLVRESPLRKKRVRIPGVCFVVLALVCMAALAYVSSLPLKMIAGVLGGVYLLLSLGICAVWFFHVGRRMI